MFLAKNERRRSFNSTAGRHASSEGGGGTLTGGMPTPGNGGGLHITGPSEVTITGSTVDGNTAANVGGGVFNDGTGGAINVLNSTLSGNMATSLGGAFIASGTFSMVNSILDGNTASTGRDVSGTITSGGFNLVSNTMGTTLVGETTGNIVDLSAVLGPLTDNGGPTRIHALMPSSPAIDAGTLAGLDVDQRNIVRPQGMAADIGAFELEVGLPFAPLQNKIAPLDVTGDGLVSQIDAFRIMNYLSRKSAQTANKWVRRQKALYPRPFHSWTSMGITK